MAFEFPAILAGYFGFVVVDGGTGLVGGNGGWIAAAEFFSEESNWGFFRWQKGEAKLRERFYVQEILSFCTGIFHWKGGGGGEK